MSTRVKILVAVLTLLLLASAGLNIYQWKTNDKVSEPADIENTVGLDGGDVEDPSKNDSVDKENKNKDKEEAGAAENNQAPAGGN